MMPARCAAVDCSEERNKDTAKRGITFHGFPKDPLRRKQWMVAVSRQTSDKKLWEPSKSSVLCSRHFKPEMFDRTGQTVRLREYAVPTEFDFQSIDESAEPCKKKKKLRASLQQESLDHDYSLPSIEILAQKLRAAEQERDEKEWQLKSLRARETGLQRSCAHIIDILLENKLISSNLREQLLPYGDMALEVFDKPVEMYSPSQRSFVTHLHLFGPKAYMHLLKKLKVPLPDPQIIRKWLRSNDEKPGFNMAIMKDLAQRKEKNPKEYTRVCLTIDTMSLKQQVDYNSTRKVLTGFINFGDGCNLHGNPEPASEVLAFMLVGVLGNWKVPVAYFFTNSLTPEAQRTLVWYVLQELVELQFEVTAVTIKSCQTNIEMCRLLGCSFILGEHLKTYFSLPGNGQKCYVVFDVSHELELKRKMLEVHGSFRSSEGFVNWNCIKNLHSLNENSFLHRGNHEPHKHENVNIQKLKLFLDVQPFNSIVADVLRILHNLKFPNFSDCLATVSFFERMVMLADILNTRSPRYKGFLGPIKSENLKCFLSFLQETKDYLLSLDTLDKSQNRRKSSCDGLLVSITSIGHLFSELLKDQEYILSHRFSLEHLKQFFNVVRGSGCNNKQPTASRFQTVFRQMLMQCGILYQRGTGNTAQGNGDFLLAIWAYTVPPLNKISVLPFSSASLMLPNQCYTSLRLRSLLENCDLYVAGLVVRKAMEYITCPECRCALVAKKFPVNFCSPYHLLELKNDGGLFVASSGTIKTIMAAECALHELIKSGYHSVSELKLQSIVLTKIGNVDVFVLGEHITETECGIDNHLSNLVRTLVSVFYLLKKDSISEILRLKDIVYPRSLKVK